MRKLRLRSGPCLAGHGSARPSRSLAPAPGRCAQGACGQRHRERARHLISPLPTGSDSGHPHVIQRGGRFIIRAISQMREVRPRGVRPKDTQLVSGGRGDCGSEWPWGLCRRCPHLECLPWVSPSLKTFLSSHLSTAEVQTPAACAAAPNTQHAAGSFYPSPPPRTCPSPTSSQKKILLNIPRTSFSISHSLCSHATSFCTLRPLSLKGAPPPGCPPETLFPVYLHLS